MKVSGGGKSPCAHSAVVSFLSASMNWLLGTWSHVVRLVSNCYITENGLELLILLLPSSERLGTFYLSISLFSPETALSTARADPGFTEVHLLLPPSRWEDADICLFWGMS